MTTANKTSKCSFLPFGLIILSLIIGGCATAPTMTSAQKQQKMAEDIYSQGRDALKNKDFATASSQFKSLEIYYPDSPYNHQAQMELAYAYFKAGDYYATIEATNHLIRNYPNNNNLDYPHYLKALASFEQSGLMIAADDNPASAQQSALTTLHYFDELETQFPDSKYKQDSDKRTAYLQEQLALYEITLARSFVEQGNYASAIIHARNVLENYPQTRSAADAMAIVDMSYEIMAIDNADTKLSTNSGAVPDVISKAVTMVTTDLHLDRGMQQASTSISTARKNADNLLLSGTHSTAWILQQPGQNYTIQLISTLKEDALSNFIHAHKLDDRVAFYRKQVNGNTWNALIYGSYANAREARAALSDLSPRLQNSKPWIQRMSSVHQSIAQFNKYAL